MVPGTHTPAHAPLTQAEATQGAGTPHVPFGWHVCTLLPEHWVAPGAQMQPRQDPATHPQPQATAAPQAPDASHVCTPVVLHSVEPGVHIPVHTPPTHA